MIKCNKFKKMRVAFIGAAGIPNRYGGFESFLEHCGPHFFEMTYETVVTCDANLYRDDLSTYFLGIRRIFLNTRANGPFSIIHDLIAFFKVYRGSTHIMVLGVSGGVWFPIFKLMCLLGGKRLGVNIDGVEWRRKKYSKFGQVVLRIFDYIAQTFSDCVVYDNAGLAEYVLPNARNKAVEIGYSGDHVMRLPNFRKVSASALTVCRIEPENNIDLLIEGVLRSELKSYTIVGNWDHSNYSRALRARYIHQSRLKLLDPIYETIYLAELRESCDIYLHGHSVGGTNPSLVEMLYYDCEILCLDVIFNRATAGEGACYFLDVSSLTAAINLVLDRRLSCDMSIRAKIREKYSSIAIAKGYLLAMRGEN